MLLRLCLLTILVLQLSSNLLAGDIRGMVSDSTGAPLAGTLVRIRELQRGAYARADGSFAFDDVPEGRYQIEAKLLGYRLYKDSVSVADDKDTRVRIRLRFEALQMKGVEVTASRRKQEQSDTRTSLLTIDPKEAKFKAGAAEDVFRALQTLPGVTAPNDFSSQLIVRGSGPDQNLIVMDNIEVFNPYRLYGFVSMFNPETVSDISLLTGGFGARYGDRLSAVLDITNREGTRDSYFAGKANVSLTNANLVTEGRIPMWNGSWVFSTRRTYYDLLAGPVARSTGALEGDVALPNFQDFQAKLAFQPMSKHKVTITGVASRDNTSLTSGSDRDQPDSISLFDRSDNDVVGMTWLWTPSERFLLGNTVSYYRNRGANNFGGSGGSELAAGGELSRDEFIRLQDSLRNAGQEVPTLFSIEGETSFNFRKTTWRTDGRLDADRTHSIEFGTLIDFITTGVAFDIQFDPRLIALRNANPRAPAIPESFGSEISFRRYSAYVQDRIRVTPELTIQPGLRWDHYEFIGKSYLSPRLSASYALNSISTLRFSSGYYVQSPGYEKLFDQQLFLDLTHPSVPTLRAEKSWHAVMGYERMLTDEWQIRLEGYYKGFDDLILQQKLQGTNFEVERIPGGDVRSRDGWTQPQAALGDSLTAVPVNAATGSSYGFEVLVQKVQSIGDNELYGWASYSFSRSNRFRGNLTIPFNFDRRHSLNLVGGWKAKDWLDINFTWTYGSGFPWTTPVGIRPRIVLETNQASGEKEAQIDTDWRGVVFDVNRGGDANLNQARLPDYHRLDVRFTTYAGWWGQKWSFYLDIINVYNRRNIVAEQYRINRETLEINTQTTQMLPILPTLGFSLEF